MREYRRLPESELDIMLAVWGERGEVTAPRILERLERPDEAIVTLREGKYHQIKRMFERFGYQVIYLKREQIGGLPLDPALPKGACRELTEEELRRLEGKEGEDAQ